MRAICKLTLLAVSTALLLLLKTGQVYAQPGVVANISQIALSATQPSTLTVAASGSPVITAIADNALNNFSSAVNITTSWNLASGGTVQLVGYFAAPAQALSTGTDHIPSTRVEGQLGAVGTFLPFNGSAVGGAGTAGGTLLLFSQVLSAATMTSTRTDMLNLRLNLVGFGAVPAGGYTGTLNLRAVVQ
jgi:hypothetical protein